MEKGFGKKPFKNNTEYFLSVEFFLFYIFLYIIQMPDIALYIFAIGFY